MQTEQVAAYQVAQFQPLRSNVTPQLLDTNHNGAGQKLNVTSQAE